MSNTIVPESSFKGSPVFKMHIENPMSTPVYNKVGDSGMDLRANITVPCELAPGERVLIPTGIRVEMPAGYEMQIRPRSGLALKHGITVVNSPGTIDANYRGTVGVIVLNTDSVKPFTINPGDRIAQAVVQQVERIEWQVVESAEDLNESARGTDGYGSSGIN